mgnify:FL=1
MAIPDEGICVEKSNFIPFKSGKEVPNKKEQRSFNLPEIVVDHCINIPEQESTESSKSVGSSTHNSLDDAQEPVLQFSQSTSSSRSESPSLSDKNSIISASLQVIGKKYLVWK